MNDRTAFLRAIDANPDDDVTRLVYADWLKENAAGDRDRATEEFLRLGCEMRAKGRQSAKEGRWLKANWRRLLPTVEEFCLKAPRREGRFVHLVIDVPIVLRGVDANWPVYAKFEFWRGFVRRCWFDCALEMCMAAPLLVPDQPLIEPHTLYVLTAARSDDTSRIDRLEMAEAWSHLQELSRGIARTEAGDDVVFEDDPFGFRAAKLRAAAFRRYARDLAEKAGAL